MRFNLSPFIRTTSFVWAVALILTVNIFRFLWLDKSPAGFHVDELAFGVTAQCLAQEGIDATDHRYPLFGECDYGNPKPPTHIYPGMLWGKIFGFSIYSLRALMATYALIAILGLFFLSRIWFGRGAAFWTAFAASLSPWLFSLSRLALETLPAVVFLVWGMFFCFRSRRAIDAALGGIFLSLAAYSYPPTRLHVVLIFVPLLLLKRKLSGLRWRETAALVCGFVLTSVPFLVGLMQGKFMRRFNDISILSESYWQTVGKIPSVWNMLAAFGQNYFKHFSFSFLFLNGDENLVYGTRAVGLLGWVESFALVAGVVLLALAVARSVRRRKSLWGPEAAIVTFLVFGVLSGVVPSGLTWSGVPHALRIVGAWPFLMCCFGYILHQATKNFVIMPVLVCLIASLFLNFYLRDYFKEYPRRSYWMFDGYAKDMALKCRTEKDWLGFGLFFRKQNFHLRYYLMNYKPGETCSSTQEKWKSVYPIP